MNSRHVTRELALMCVLTLVLVQSLFSGNPPVSYGEAQKAAHSYAAQFWSEVQVGEGTIFVDPADCPIIYMFPIYCGQGAFPDEAALCNHVASARAYRLQGEALVKQGEELKDSALIEKGCKMVEEGWQRMRDEDHFGTVFISALHWEHPGVEMYRGLPLNYVALADVKQIAESTLAARSVVLKRYIFWGLFDYGAEFEANGRTVLINLKTRELINTEPPPSGTESGWFIKEHPDREVQTPENPGFHKPLEPPDPAPPFSSETLWCAGLPDRVFKRLCTGCCRLCVGIS